MQHSRISVIEGHTRDSHTDDLYKPLRDTLLLDTTAKKTFLEDVAKFSRVTHAVKAHTFVENHQLGERTLILEDAHLTPTHDLSRIPVDRHYTIINAQQRVMDPISPDELERRLKVGDKEEIIVYAYGEQEQPEPKVTGTPRPLSRPRSGLKVTQPKYNLFSSLDEACNTMSCACPANEIIAGRRNEISWQEVQELSSAGIMP